MGETMMAKLLTFIHTHPRLVTTLLLILLLVTALCVLAVLTSLPPDLDTYGVWCSVRCGGGVECLKECMVDRPGWWR